MKRITTIISLLLIAVLAHAQIENELVDNTFGSNGIALGNVGNPYQVIYTASALQPDGKIVVAGTVDTFNSQVAFAMRFNSDGSTDNTFANGSYVESVNGFVTDSIVAVALQADGKIVAAGFTNQGGLQTEHILVLRFNSTGVLDNTFGTNGRAVISKGSLNLEAWAVAIENDQKIVLAGYSENVVSGPDEFMVARLTTTGALDASFGSGGFRTTNFFGYGDYAYAVTIQPDQKIVAAGITATGPANSGYSNTLAIARYTTTGVLDNTFGTSGKTYQQIGMVHGYDQVCAVGLQSTGNIVVAGTGSEAGRNDFATIRFSTAGVVDSTFGYNGIAITDFEQQDNTCLGMAINTNDYIALTGKSEGSNGNLTFQAALAYCTPDGNPDISWGTQGKALTPNTSTGSDIPYTAMIQPDQKILIIGSGYYPGGNRVAMERYYITEPNAVHSISDNVFTIYPNPAKGQMCIQLNSNALFTNYTVYNAIGETLLTGQIDGGKQNFDVASLSAGVYLLRLNDGNQVAVRSFVIEK